MRIREAVDALLPLPTATFHLIALAQEDRRHAVILVRPGAPAASLRLSAGTLYRSSSECSTKGSSRKRVSAPPPSPRQRCELSITVPASAVARAETERMACLDRWRAGRAWRRAARMRAYQVLLSLDPASSRRRCSERSSRPTQLRREPVGHLHQEGIVRAPAKQIVQIAAKRGVPLDRR